MIINIEQRQGKLIVSHINKEGKLAYMQLNVPVSHQFSYAYSKYASGSAPGLKSWDGKPVRKVPSGFLTKHRIQEFFMDAGESLTAPLFERNMPQLYSCDIEVDVTDDGFAEAGDARNKINSIGWSHYPEVFVFGLKDLSGDQCNEIEKEINDHVKAIGKEYKFIYKKYESESDMLYDFLYNYARHAPLITGWHFWNFDWRYIYNRCKRLNLDISWMSPTRQWYKHKIMDRNNKVDVFLPQHKLIVDYMEIYKKWDRVIDPKENNSLDFAAEAALGIKKVKYSGTFQDLYRDFPKHVFYNAIDTILVEEIHNKLKTMETFLGLANINRVEAMNAFSPISMLEATATRYAYKRGLVFPKANFDRAREDYEGAFVFKPIPDLYGWVVSFDYASLYPSIMRQFKISMENFVVKNPEYITKPHEIKCSSGAVFDASIEPLLPEILTDYYAQRKEAQKIAKKAEIEADELKQILQKRLSSAEKSLA
jgi:DNA polymerase elongation subunit (family B)